MKCATLVAFIGAIVLCSGVAAFAPLGGGAFAVTRFTIDGGGGTSSGGSYMLSGTIGQPDAGQMTGGSYTLSGGFFLGQVNSPPSCPGDTNGDGDVDVNDLNNVILDWGTDGSANGGDLTDATGTGPPDGIVNVNDLNAVVVGWGKCP